MQNLSHRTLTMTPNNHAVELYTHPDFKKGAPNSILFIGGVHGDEPEGVRLAQDLLNHLQTHDITRPWALIPCLNPDGFAKNSRVNANGVDLNRNYPSSNWAAGFEKPEYNPGTHAASEVEVAAAMSVINDTLPSVIIHFHSWEPCVVCTGEPGLPEAKALAEASGYNLQDHIGYPTPGSLSSVGWHDMNIPVICLEAQMGADLDAIWPRFKTAFEKNILA
jgi:murein peptide amidase A